MPKEVENLVEIINDFFGCDAAYFDVNPFDLAMHLINNNVHQVVPCNGCTHWDSKDYDYGQGWCDRVAGYRPADWFCKYGEPRTISS